MYVSQLYCVRYTREIFFGSVITSSMFCLLTVYIRNDAFGHYSEMHLAWFPCFLKVHKLLEFFLPNFKVL